jgi:hypothetical protein
MRGRSRRIANLIVYVGQLRGASHGGWRACLHQHVGAGAGRRLEGPDAFARWGSAALNLARESPCRKPNQTSRSANSPRTSERAAQQFAQCFAKLEARHEHPGWPHSCRPLALSTEARLFPKPCGRDVRGGEAPKSSRRKPEIELPRAERRPTPQLSASVFDVERRPEIAVLRGVR